MRKLIAVLLVAISICSVASNVFAAVSVRGYYRSNGTYVAPHYRTSPDSSVYNNYSYWD